MDLGGETISPGGRCAREPPKAHGTDAVGRTAQPTGTLSETPGIRIKVRSIAMNVDTVPHTDMGAVGRWLTETLRAGA
jgi:hypothetical protein